MFVKLKEISLSEGKLYVIDVRIYRIKDMLLKYSIFEEYNLVNFTSTTKGGVSVGNYSTMNPCLYCNDDIGNVIKNQTLLAECVGVLPSRLFIPHQTHEDKIRLIDRDFLSFSSDEQKEKLEGIDAIITQEKNICIGITTADCVPILVYDPIGHALGAAHAGWKGTVLKIGAKMVSEMQKQFDSRVEDLRVAIGPSISPQMFEVGDEVGEAFEKAGFDLTKISMRHSVTHKLHIDLWEANKSPLISMGVLEEHIEIAGICTYQNDEFFSARRQTIHSGRMVTGGVLK